MIRRIWSRHRLSRRSILRYGLIHKPMEIIHAQTQVEIKRCIAGTYKGAGTGRSKDPFLTIQAQAQVETIEFEKTKKCTTLPAPWPPVPSSTRSTSGFTAHATWSTSGSTAWSTSVSTLAIPSAAGSRSPASRIGTTLHEQLTSGSTAQSTFASS